MAPADHVPASKGRNRRIVRYIASVSLLPTLFNTLLVGFFAYMIFISGAMTSRLFGGRGGMTQLANGEWQIVLPVSTNISIRLIVFGVLALIALISVIRGVRAMVLEYKRRSAVKIERVADYLAGRPGDGRGFVLALRPFETDGFLYVRKKQTYWERVWSPGVPTQTVEQIVGSACALHGGLDVVAIADPNKEDLAPGPQYLMTGDDWQTDVADLIERATAILFIFPRNAQLTEGVEWEIAALAARGAREKTAVVFDANRWSRQKHDDILARLYQGLDMTMGEIGPRDTMFFLGLGDDGLVHYRQNAMFPLNRLQSTDSDGYFQIIYDWIGRVKRA